MASYLLLEDGERRLSEDGGFRVLEDHTVPTVGTAQWACRGLIRLTETRGLVRLTNVRGLSR